MQPNVLLVVIDSVRAKNTSLHDYERKTTPFLEEFAGVATHYQAARAPSVASNPSHASMFTGLHAEEHMLTDRTKALSPGFTIFDELAREGYRTGLFTGNKFLSQLNIGFADAIDIVESGSEHRLLFPLGYDPRLIDSAEGNKYLNFLMVALRHERPLRSLFNGAIEKLPYRIVDRFPGSIRPTEHTGEQYTDLFLEWVSIEDGPWAACINYMDAHMPYLPVEEYDRWSRPEASDPRALERPSFFYFSEEANSANLKDLRDYYDGSILQVDAIVGRLVQELDKRGLYDETLLVICADHGEGFGEPSDARSKPTIGHGVSGGVAEEVLHVPLLVKGPGQTTGRTVTEPASLTRFPDAVRQALANKLREDAFVPDGAAISYMAGMLPIIRPTAERHVDDLSPFEPAIRVVYEATEEGALKYIHRGNEALLIECPDAQTIGTIEEVEPSIVDERYPNLERADVLRDDGGAEDLSAGLQQQLEYLGYV